MGNTYLLRDISLRECARDARETRIDMRGRVEGGVETVGSLARFLSIIVPRIIIPSLSYTRIFR